MINNKKIKIYFVGIGGIGMSGIAELMHEIGYSVLGSDKIESDNVKRLKKIGINVKIGHDKNHLSKEKWTPLWVIDFPMFDYDDEGKRWNALHHPFTAPKDGHEVLLEKDPGNCLSKAYDMVINGWEVGGGSIRIHDQSVQSKVFTALDISKDEASE